MFLNKTKIKKFFNTQLNNLIHLENNGKVFPIYRIRGCGPGLDFFKPIMKGSLPSLDFYESLFFQNDNQYIMKCLLKCNVKRQQKLSRKQKAALSDK